MSEHGTSFSIGFSSSSNTLGSGGKADVRSTPDMSFSTKLSEAAKPFSRDQTPFGKEGNRSAKADSPDAERTTPARNSLWSKSSSAQVSKSSDATETGPAGKQVNAQVEQTDTEAVERSAVQSEDRNRSLTVSADRSDEGAEPVSDKLVEPDSQPIGTVAGDLHNRTVQSEGNGAAALPLITNDPPGILAVASDGKAAGLENTEATNAENNSSDSTLDIGSVHTNATEGTDKSNASIGATVDSAASASAVDALSVAAVQSSGAESVQTFGANKAATVAGSVADTAASTATGAGADTATDTDNGATVTRSDSTTMEIQTVTSLTQAEQLTPAALASRQAHSVQMSPVPAQNVTQITDEQPLDNAQTELQSDVTRAVTLTRGVMLDTRTSAAALVTTEVVPDTSDLSMATATTDDGEAAEQQLQQRSDRQSAGVTDAIIEEQLSDEKLIQRNQLQQQLQNQNQQLNQQLSQQVSAAASASQGSLDDFNRISLPAADNMLHSVAGGTVTAPLPTRAEAGNIQTIYAPINTPILQNDANEAMAGNIRWMTSQGVKNARINLTPSGMGPISVTIGMDQEQMNVSIVAPHGTTRDALEAMLPRLREQLGLQGHTSINVDISDGRSENSGRESTDQFADSQQNSEHNARAQDGYLQSDSLTPAADAGTTSAHQQGLMGVTTQGQLTNRYDVYV